MIRISFLNGPRAGEVINLSEGTWTVGRAPDNALMIPEASVSARHAELLVSMDEVIVKELGARNGTFVQGRRVEVQYPVESGQTVRFGAVDVRVTADGEAESGDATGVTASYALRKPAGESTPAPRQFASANTTKVSPEATQAAPIIPPEPQPPSVPPAATGAAPNGRGHWLVGGCFVLGVIMVVTILWLVWR